LIRNERLAIFVGAGRRFGNRGEFADEGPAGAAIEEGEDAVVAAGIGGIRNKIETVGFGARLP